MTTVQESFTINATRAQIRPILFDPGSIQARETSIYQVDNLKLSELGRMTRPSSQVAP